MNIFDNDIEFQMDMMAKSKKPALTRYVAASDNATEWQLSACLSCDDEMTTLLVAEHPNATADMLESLAHWSGNADVQSIVAENPNVSTDTLKYLTENGLRAGVRAKAQRILLAR